MSWSDGETSETPHLKRYHRASGADTQSHRAALPAPGVDMGGGGGGDTGASLVAMGETLWVTWKKMRVYQVNAWGNLWWASDSRDALGRFDPSPSQILTAWRLLRSQNLILSEWVSVSYTIGRSEWWRGCCCHTAGPHTRFSPSLVSYKTHTLRILRNVFHKDDAHYTFFCFEFTFQTQFQRKMSRHCHPPGNNLITEASSCLNAAIFYNPGRMWP